MDLIERTNNTKQRHPWEIARLKALRQILKMKVGSLRNKQVLDVGCGDAFLSAGLSREQRCQHIDAVDIHLNDEQLHQFSFDHRPVVFHNDWSGIKTKGYDLILLLDVVEHVENDLIFVNEILNRHLAPNGWVLLTAPAFQSLFSSHDRFMGHYRRYNLKGLLHLAVNAGTTCIHSGYFFFSLAVVRFFILIFERLFCLPNLQKGGVGNWRHGRYLTEFIEKMLRIENMLLVLLSTVGIRLPGLTVWILCRKPQ